MNGPQVSMIEGIVTMVFIFGFWPAVAFLANLAAREFGSDA